MSATLSTIIHPAAATSPGSSLRTATAYWKRIRRHFVDRAAIAHLRDLDDDALRDIGLAYSEIEAAVRGFMTAPNRTRL
ncbi:DUF1127 domain-containing protein [Microvirga zambiensis]|uniref:DUF1127 domain-containing protein n=1 Tax=Microvirga zambiensis TaxID=1402137 RepID=UPI00191D9415|nr:DUF1127 domain-containing protein [Microvirga zambiensis]